MGTMKNDLLLPMSLTVILQYFHVLLRRCDILFPPNMVGRNAGQSCQMWCQICYRFMYCGASGMEAGVGAKLYKCVLCDLCQCVHYDCSLNF